MLGTFGGKARRDREGEGPRVTLQPNESLVNQPNPRAN